MRFDTPIYFQTITTGEYLANGDYAEPIVTEEKRYASVTNAGDETVRLVFGELKQGCLTVRLQTPFTAPFDRVRIGSKVYTVAKSRRLKNKHTFVISEVQGNAEN